ncbi:hypothetical protein F2Q70_00018460 [Brassica cretica]|uniref:Uncharacterized protein n=1 Tax=Brassica cretica TaxID=69181 RepID=A0A8S9I661_BRACR|nr:hypothetical protein F2Q70_00018460 [Brassica cretica]
MGEFELDREEKLITAANYLVHELRSGKSLTRNAKQALESLLSELSRVVVSPPPSLLRFVFTGVATTTATLVITTTGHLYFIVSRQRKSSRSTPERTDHRRGLAPIFGAAGKMLNRGMVKRVEKEMAGHRVAHATLKGPKRCEGANHRFSCWWSLEDAPLEQTEENQSFL